MDKRKLGASDLNVFPVCLGGNVFGWTLDENESKHILDLFAGQGFNFIDTADSYSRWAPGNQGGESETIIGNWMASRRNRDKVVVATKVGSDMGQGKFDLSRKYILKAAEDSLRRLQTDYIDLYWSHWDDLDTPVEETLEAYAELVKSGKVRWIGASNLSPERIHASMKASKENGYPAYVALQPHYNLYAREDYERDYEPLAAEYGFGVAPYYALAKGFLTGKYRSEADLGKSVRGGGVKDYLNPRGLAILDALDEVASRHSVSQASVAMAWLLTRPNIVAPIASATSDRHLDALTVAASLELSGEDVAKLETAS